MPERRHDPRARSMFKSAYVRTDSGLKFLTLRNISEAGVCLDSWPGVAEGDDIEFCIDADLRKGIVRWVKDGLCGIGAAEYDAALLGSQCFPPRAVRLPLSVPAELFVFGRQNDVILRNLSIRGACITGDIAIAPGQLVSLIISGTSFELSTIRWVNNGLFGLRFAEPVHPTIFRDLVARIQTPSTGA